MPHTYPGHFPATRLRRGRATDFSRRLVRENRLTRDDLIYPIFVTEGEAMDIQAMPGQKRHTLTGLADEIDEVVALGIPMIVLFPVIDPTKKSLEAEEAANPDGPIPTAIRQIKARHPELGVMTDVALDPYTSHGQDGVIDESDREELIEALLKQNPKLDKAERWDADGKLSVL